MRGLLLERAGPEKAVRPHSRHRVMYIWHRISGVIHSFNVFFLILRVTIGAYWLIMSLKGGKVILWYVIGSWILYIELCCCCCCWGLPFPSFFIRNWSCRHLQADKLDKTDSLDESTCYVSRVFSSNTQGPLDISMENWGFSWGSVNRNSKSIPQEICRNGKKWR